VPSALTPSRRALAPCNNTRGRLLHWLLSTVSMPVTVPLISAEAIAFYRGERREADVAGTRLRSLVAVARLKVCPVKTL